MKRLNEGTWLANLGIAYRDLGQLDRTRSCWQKSLAIFEEIKSPNADRIRKWLAELDAPSVES